MHQLWKLETRGPLHCRLLSSFTERTEHHEGNGFLHATQHHDRLMRGKSNENSTGCRSSWTCCTLHVNAVVCALSCFGSEMSNLLLAAWLCLCQSSKDLITIFICYMLLVPQPTRMCIQTLLQISFWLGSARQTMSCTATARLEDLLLSVLVFAELMTSDDPSDCMSFHVFSVFLFELSINQAQEQKTEKNTNKYKEVMVCDHNRTQFR